MADAIQKWKIFLIKKSTRRIAARNLEHQMKA
jgi:hypothetical protein